MLNLKLIFLFSAALSNTLLILLVVSIEAFAYKSLHQNHVMNQFLVSRDNAPVVKKILSYPHVPKGYKEIAALIEYVESQLIKADTPYHLKQTLGHQQQVIYRQLAREKSLSNNVLALLSPKIKRIVDHHLSARQEFLSMNKRTKPINIMPTWEIISPEPIDKLLSYYQKAEEATGIEWEVLAAINLVETAMGRIKGVSIANAHGPMQFLLSTWNQPGVGLGGDIYSPHDAIPAAARYLVIRGGLKDIKKGLWGYNNSDHYVRAVMQYVALLKEEPLALNGLYHWQVHINTTLGDLWLPVGYDVREKIPISTYLQKYPISAPSD